MSDSNSNLLGALRLRRWALQLLAGDLAPPPDIPPDAWHLFLGREACATRLRLLAPALSGPLRRAADLELQRILHIRMELDAVLAVARKAGVRPILLKGGSVLHHPGRAVAGRDLDLLLPGAEASALLAAMAAEGWCAEGRGPVHHHADRIRPGGIPVEVHSAEAGSGVCLGPEVERRAIPHPEFEGARLLHPEDQARHLAYHQTIQHSSHRGRLRDLILLSDALADLGTAPRVKEWGFEPEELGPIETTVACATTLRREHRLPDPNEEMAAVWYQLDAHASSRSLTLPERFGNRWLFDIVAGGGSPARRWRLMQAEQLDVGHPTLLRVARFLAFPPILAFALLRAMRLRANARALLAALDGAPDDRREGVGPAVRIES